MRADEVIASHGNTDFDAFGAMLAARRLYPSAVVAVGALNRNVRDFYRLHAEELGPVVEARDLDLGAIRKLIVVEARSASRLGELEPVALDPTVEKVLFDHHGSADLPEWIAPDAAVLSEDGALTTTLVGILAEREIVPTPLEATAFALGIHEDTGSLTYSSTTQRDVDALSWCLRHGARQELVAEYLHTPLSVAERDLLQALLGALEAVDAAGDEVLIAAVRWPTYVEGVSNLAHKVVDLTDARALVVLVEMEGRVFAVARSRTERIDASTLAAALGGGGHAHAASAIARLSLEEARSVVGEALGRAQRETRRARDVMSTPPRTVRPEDTVGAAMALCRRHKQSGVFVAEDGKVLGAVRREDLDKAIAHGLAHAPVRGIMSGHVVSADEDATLGELQSLVTRAEDGRVAVLRGDELVGVVTRADLLRALEGTEPAREEPAESLAEEISRVPRLASLIEAVATLGAEAEGVYLVGGTVRDILLGEESFDVDVAVEG
ncbi:MAG: CBS domain-containing protein, partial [Thermoleophilia bacterium]|nr:CBS domain-containing protein [Gaiellaceae bacterium]MDW8338751.1 CBS domain-containing protein [Thermoleophilia bacterium]